MAKTTPFTLTNPAVDALFRPVVSAYLRLRERLGARGGFAAKLVRDDLLFFLIGSIGLLAAAPPLLFRVWAVVQHVLGGPAVDLHALPALPKIPTWFIVAIALAFSVFHLGARARAVALVGGSLVLGGLIGSEIDFRSLGAYALFLLLVFAVIQTPLRRALAVTVVWALAVGFLLLVSHWSVLAEYRVAEVVIIQTAMLPPLWYSVYQHSPPKRRLSFRRFVAYHYTRLFEAPVATYQDYFPLASGEALTRLRFLGLRTLYLALAAAGMALAVDRMLPASRLHNLSGFPLLVASYFYYVGGYCHVVAKFNAFIGVVRYFGVPIRDNFNYWLTARTPNEHWQRWNILFREWIITAVFFPIMRKKRWLFVAVMAALLTSGLMHIVTRLAFGTPDLAVFSIVLAYWTLNGLTIYAVIKLPLLFPALQDRLGMRHSRAWAIAGIVATSAFYGVTTSVRESCHSWAEVADYFCRLVGA